MRDDLLGSTIQELKAGLLSLVDSLSVLSATAEIDIQSLDEQAILQEALRALVENHDLKRCSIFLVEDNHLVNVAGIDWTEILEPGNRCAGGTSTRFKLNEGVMGIAAASGELQHCRNCAEDPRFHANPNAGPPPAGSLISAPIALGAQVLGVLNISHPQPNFFTSWHERLTLVLSHILAQLITNHRLLKRLEGIVAERTQELEEALREARSLKRQYEQLAFLDDLTQLPNRRYFFVQMEPILERAIRYQQPLSLLVIDLDNFKKINDTHGHAAGDEALRRVARLLQDDVRRGDVLARYGGDEFVLALPHTDEAAARQLGERIQAQISNMEVLDGDGRVDLTMSVGIATWQGEDSDESGRELVTRLLREADAAMYDAKEKGRNATLLLE